MAYSFFLSYASHDAPPGDGAVEWFFRTLNQQLVIVHGARRVDQGGFMAPVGIEPGETWRRTLPRAINTSKILICLFSPNYFDSEYCGKELEVFLRRRKLFEQRTGVDAPDCVLPVPWQPVPFEIPKGVPDFQEKRIRDDLQAEGLYQAYIARSDLTSFVHRLAQRTSSLLLRNVRDLELPSLPDDPDLDAVESAFALPSLPLPDLDVVKGAGPKSVTFVYPRNLPPEEWPWPAPEHALTRAAAIAKSRELDVQGIEFEDGGSHLLDRLQRAQSLNSAIIVVLPSQWLGDRNLLSSFETIRPDGLAAIFVWLTGNPQVPPDVLQNLRVRGLLYGGISTPALLDKAVATSLAKLREKLRERAASAIERSTPHNALPGL